MARKKGAKNGSVGNGIDKRLFEFTLKNRLYNCKEVAEMFNVDINTLRAWICKTYEDKGWTTFEEVKSYFRKQKGGLEEKAQTFLITQASRDFRALCALYDYLYKGKKPNEQINESDDSKKQLEQIVGKITLVTKEQVREEQKEVDSDG